MLVIVHKIESFGVKYSEHNFAGAFLRIIFCTTLKYMQNTTELQ